jgi:hypothetical protein
MRNGSSRQQRKWMKGVLGLVAAVAPIGAYADLVNTWPSRQPLQIGSIYHQSGTRFATPLKRSMPVDEKPSSHRVRQISSTAVRERVVGPPVSKVSSRQAKTPTTLALILMMQAQDQRNP